MHELISHPGLQFCMSQLSGSLTYTFKADGKLPKVYKLHETDFDDADVIVKEEDPIDIRGTEASAVGLRLRLLKNTVSLEILYEGNNGGSALWNFEGLTELVRAGKLYAAASVQTALSQVTDSGIQTSTAGQTHANIQTIDIVTPQYIDTWHNLQYDRYTTAQGREEHRLVGFSDREPKKETKRLGVNNTSAISAIPQAQPSRYIFLWGYKREPRLSKNHGALRIDTLHKEAIWQERSGDYPWKWEKREGNIDLREPRLTVEVLNMERSSERNRDSDEYSRFKFAASTGYLQLVYPSGPRISKRFSLEFVGTPEMYESADANGTNRAKVSEIGKVVKAIEDCITRQSGIPIDFWLRGGTGIPIEPGSVVKASS